MNIKDFKNPAPVNRAAPFWSWNDKLEEKEVRRQIDEMAEKGWGGYFMHSRVGLVTEYLSEEWMDIVKACADEAGKTNTYAWLYDEDKWPSGYAGGIVPDKKDEYRQHALVLLKKDEITDNDKVLTEIKNEDYYICRRISPMGNEWFNGKCYVDLMNPEMVETFLEVTHEKYKEECGEYFGKEIPGIFTDEPCYLMEGHFQVPVLPWSTYLPDFFEKLKGYKIENHLEQLFFDKGDYQKIRFDFFDSATRLFLDSFTKKYYNWCEENDLKMTGHFMAEDNLPYQTKWIGAAMPHYEYMHWPGIDKLGRHIEQLVTVKQVTSAADQLGKERSFCEVFGTSGQQVSFYNRKWIADWEAALGISFVNHHLSLYSMRGERKRDFPPNFFYQQPWWEEEKEFGDYIGRISKAVAEGKRKVDVLIIHPIASVWSEYSPLNADNNHAVETGYYDQPFASLSQKLVNQNIDFHYGDEIIMENNAEIKDGELVIGEHSYSTVVIPPANTLRKNTVDLLKQFRNSEKNLIAIKPVPQRVDGEQAELSINPEVVENVDKCVNLLDEKYSNRTKIIDRITGENATAIISQERKIEDEKLLFLCNTDNNREIKTTISISDKRKPLIIDLMSGNIYEVPYEVQENKLNIEVEFYPAGSILILLTDKDYKPATVPSFLDSGIGFKKKKTEEIFIKEKDWDIEILEDNVLPLNEVTLYMDEKKVMEEEPVANAWHNYFYPAENGTHFKAEYRFDVKNVPEEPMTAAIEVAENLDKITLNGTKLKPLKNESETGVYDPDKNWKDISFTRVPLADAVKEGENTLVIEGEKVNNITAPGCHIGVDNFKEHKPTEVEAVYITGDFAVENIDNTRFIINGDKDEITKGNNLNNEGYPFYAGKVEYSAEIDYKEGKEKETLLKVNKVKSACIELYVNGKKAGNKYWEPYIYDISGYLREGENEIKVVAATTLFNLTGPNWISGIKNDTGVSPQSFVDFSRYTEKYSFFPFGIG
ncbi:MAG: glycoside hydrolase, partial [Halanaerobiales bacterium]